MPKATSWLPVPSGLPPLAGDHAETVPLRCLARDEAAAGLALAQQPQARLAADVATAVTDGRSLEQVLSRCTNEKRARDEMLAMVAHDLRNPLNVVELASQLLLSDPTPDADATRKTVEMIQRAGSRMNRLIADLLDVKQIEAGSFRVEIRPELPSAVVRDALDMLQPIAAAKGQQLDTAIEPGLPAVEVDGARIHQVISNLVGNAIKFSPTGSVVTIGAQARAGAVRISVTDTGPGIRPEELPRIFDRYWQGKGRERGGFGLGLAIAKAIVEAHGGCIGVSSAPGAGTTFYFDVPLLPGAESRRVEHGTVGASNVATP
jgi:signal transduction histidine kinase